MSEIEKTPTPAECFAAMKEPLDEFADLIRTVPLSPEHRSGLSFLVAAHFFGLTASLMGKDVETNAREVCDLIVATMRPNKPKIRLIEEEVILKTDPQPTLSDNREP